MPDKWEFAFKVGDDRPPFCSMELGRFYALVGPASGWLRGLQLSTPRSQRWEWQVSRRSSPGHQSTLFAKGSAGSRRQARACAAAVLRAMACPTEKNK